MNKMAFFAVLSVLILGIVYVFKSTDHPPATGITQTPKQYIEQVERSKAAKRTEAQEDDSQSVAAEAQGAAIR